MAIQLSDIRALFARSGNRCAFPGCGQHLIDADNLFVGQICHIEAASSAGPRYNIHHTEAERDCADNLLLLCYPHHRRVDSDPTQYTVEWLHRIKAQHEATYRSTPFDLDVKVAATILAETQEYWGRLHTIQRAEAEKFDMAVSVNPDASFQEVFSELQALLDNIWALAGVATAADDSVRGGATPWEAQNIFLPNALQQATLCLKQLEVQFLSCRLQLAPESTADRAAFEKAKAQLVHLVTTLGYAD